MISCLVTVACCRRSLVRDNETPLLYYGSLPGAISQKLLCVTHLES